MRSATWLFSSIGVPEKTAAAIASRMKQERETEAARKRDEGKTKAEEIRTLANTEKSKMITQAQAKAKALMAEGDAEAASYYAVFTKEPELATFLRKLQAMKKILSSKSTLSLSTESAPFDVLNGTSDAFAAEGRPAQDGRGLPVPCAEDVFRHPGGVHHRGAGMVPDFRRLVHR